MVKAVVDIKQGIMAIGGELHSDEEAILLDHGSLRGNLWGINLYLEKSAEEWIEFDSMINVRPSGGNRSRYVESAEIREAVTKIAINWWRTEQHVLPACRPGGREVAHDAVSGTVRQCGQ